MLFEILSLERVEINHILGELLTDLAHKIHMWTCSAYILKLVEFILKVSVINYVFNLFIESVH